MTQRIEYRTSPCGDWIVLVDGPDPDRAIAERRVDARSLAEFLRPGTPRIEAADNPPVDDDPDGYGELLAWRDGDGTITLANDCDTRRWRETLEDHKVPAALAERAPARVTPADIAYIWTRGNGTTAEHIPGYYVNAFFDDPLPAAWPTLADAYHWHADHYRGPDQDGVGLDWT